MQAPSKVEIGDGLRRTPSDVELRVASLELPDRSFYAGQFCDIDGPGVDNITPISGKRLTTIYQATSSDVDAAVRSARFAVEDGPWSTMAPRERKHLLLAFRDKVLGAADELALIDALDVGKPIGAARSVDVNEAIHAIEWYAEAIDKVYGGVAPTPTLDVIVHSPIGVVAAVTPWNYPLMIAAWKFAPILAAGNSLVLKPAEQSPHSALRIAELAAEAGLPPGVFNVLLGGAEVGEILGRHAGVDMVTFTGSSRVGKLFLKYSGESNMKAVSLECGGKSAAVVAADANLDEVAAGIAGGLFYNAGQSCNAPTRILVHESIADEFVASLIEQSRQYKPDNPLAEGVAVGCIVSREQLDRVASLVETAPTEGAEIAIGGAPIHGESGGYFFEPTIITGVSSGMIVSQEEIFGPVAPVETFRTTEEAVRSANATQYGLWASIWTNRLDFAIGMARQLKAGSVAVNNAFGGDITTPMGGVKQSGIGRDRSLEAFRKYAPSKHIHINL